MKEGQYVPPDMEILQSKARGEDPGIGKDSDEEVDEESDDDAEELEEDDDEQAEETAEPPAKKMAKVDIFRNNLQKLLTVSRWSSRKRSQTNRQNSRNEM